MHHGVHCIAQCYDGRFLVGVVALAPHGAGPDPDGFWGCTERIWKAFGIKPHLVGTFKISNDPHFIANVFMHYAFDAWMVREFPGRPFERCRSRRGR